MKDYDTMACLMRLARQVRRHPVEGRRHGHSAGKLLHILYKHENETARELADRMGIRPPSLSEQLDKLEARGYIARVRDAGDARVVRVRLTEAGRQEVIQHNAGWEETRGMMDGILTDEEKKQFCALCTKLSNALEAAGEKGGREGK